MIHAMTLPKLFDALPQNLNTISFCKTFDFQAQIIKFTYSKAFFNLLEIANAIANDCVKEFKFEQSVA